MKDPSSPPPFPCTPVRGAQYLFSHIPNPLPSMPMVVRMEVFPPGIDTGLHRQDDFCGLHFLRSGRGMHNVDGQSYNLMRGDVYIMSPGAYHGYRNYDSLQVYCIYFPLTLLTKAEVAALRATEFWNLLAPANARRRASRIRRLHLLPEQFSQAETMVSQIFDESNTPPLGNVLARYSFFRLLAMLAGWYDARAHKVGAGEKPEHGRKEHHSMAQIVRYCEENFHQPLTLPQLAARAYISPAQFARLFKRATGMPPATYLRQLRLAHAQTLMHNTTLGLEEIARACGLGGADQLSRAFRQTFGASPGKYRREKQS